MTLLLLAATTSWKVEKHYCMGHLIDVSFFAEAEDCGMNMPISADDNSQVPNQDSCCDDELVIVEGQDNLKLPLNDLSFDQQFFWVTLAHAYLAFFEIETERIVPQEHYPPPLLVKNIQLLDEVFLI